MLTARKSANAVMFASFFLFAMQAQSQEPTPSPGEMGQPEQAHPGGAEDHAAADQQNTKPQPIIVNVLPTPKTEPEAAEERREREEKTELDRRLVDLTNDVAIFTGGLFAATIVLSLFTAALWWSTRRLVKGAEETAKRQLRAYVLVASAKLDLPKPDTKEAHMSFKNFGQTPAYNLRIWINMWIEEDPLRVVLPSPPANFQMATSILPPGGHTDMVIPNNAPVPTQSVHLLGTPEGTIYVYGEVR
ncbi:MAG: hypothetical protein ACREC0_11800 [Methylocella sp.]